jgi:RNA polymerase sigma-70 factor (ECF subfamily)
MFRRVVHKSDAALLSLIAAGEELALAELYDRFGRVAYGLALRILRDPRLAEEAVQDAFLSAWRSAGRFDATRGLPRSWLLTIVHRRAVDLVQHAVRRPEVPAEELPEGSTPPTEETAALREERRAVRQALEKRQQSGRAFAAIRRPPTFCSGRGTHVAGPSLVSGDV